MVHTIIIVDDEMQNRDLFREVLQSADYNVIESVDGMDVLDLARENQPSIILMDIRLPHKSGIELTLLLKSDTGLKHIPVIAVTASASKWEGTKEIREAGFDDFIAKPVSLVNFLETVEKHIHTSSQHT